MTFGVVEDVREAMRLAAARLRHRCQSWKLPAHPPTPSVLLQAEWPPRQPLVLLVLPLRLTVAMTLQREVGGPVDRSALVGPTLAPPLLVPRWVHRSLQQVPSQLAPTSLALRLLLPFW